VFAAVKHGATPPFFAFMRNGAVGLNSEEIEWRNVEKACGGYFSKSARYLLHIAGVEETGPQQAHDFM
jgi:hypothetical protein